MNHHGIQAIRGQIWPCVEVVEYVFNSVGPKAHADATDARPTKNPGQVVVAASTTNAPHRGIVHDHFKNGPSVVIQSTRKQRIDAQRLLGHASAHGQRDELFQRSKRLQSCFTVLQQARQRGQTRLQVLVVADGQKVWELGGCVFRKPPLFEFSDDPVHPNLVQLVDGHSPVRELFVRHPGPRCQGLEDAPVVDQDFETRNIQCGQSLMKDLHQLQFTERAVRADDVAIALGELLVPPLARSVAAPHVLDLIPLEWKGQLVPVHHHKSGKRNREIIP